MYSQTLTVSNVQYNSNNDETYVDVEEEIRFLFDGTLFNDAVITPTARAMYQTGGVMYYGGVSWPTRFPDVAYTESGSYDVRLQNEYTSSGFSVRGPYREVTGVSKVMAAWHLETAMHVYVKDSVAYEIVNTSTSNDYFDLDEKVPHVFQTNKTFDVDGTTFTVSSANWTGDVTRINVDEDVNSSGSTATIDVWSHQRRATPSEQGLYTVQGADYVSNYIFDKKRYENEDDIAKEEIPPSATYVDETQVAVSSRVNRPLEVTSNGFSVPENSKIVAMMSARLAEEEGLRSYDFYVGTGEAIYVAEPQVEEDTVQLLLVTGEYGVGTNQFLTPVHTSVPGGAVFKDTSGVLRLLSGRREERLFPEGTPPWSQVNDVEFDVRLDELAIATDDGLWYFDWNRQGLYRQYDLFNPASLIYDQDQQALLGWDPDADSWKQFDESGDILPASVTTQFIETGGREVEILWVKSEYDKSGYDNTASSSFAEVWHSMRSEEVMDYDENPDMIIGSPKTVNTESSGNTAIEISTGASESVDLKAGDLVRFINHATTYEVASDVSIGSSSSGTVNLVTGLSTSVSSSTTIRPDKYRAIFKLPSRERVRPRLRGIGHQIRVRKFDSLRDIQFRAKPRIEHAQ
jgi:hypothetical protein